MTSATSVGSCVLARTGFPKEERAGLCDRSRQLTFSMSCVGCHFFHTVLPLIGRAFAKRFRQKVSARSTTPEELPSSSTRGTGAFSVTLHRPLLSSLTYRLVLLPSRDRLLGRQSRIFAGQCCQPFCFGDDTSHSDGPQIVTKYRSAKESIKLSGLQQAWEPGPPSEPKRAASETVFTWPLRRRLLPSDAGCLPRRCRQVRVKISKRAWTRSGKI
jgi:hypothetical protein